MKTFVSTYFAGTTTVYQACETERTILSLEEDVFVALCVDPLASRRDFFTSLSALSGGGDVGTIVD